MSRTFKQELEEFNKTDLYLYKIVIALETQRAAEFFEVDLTDNEYEIACDFIYDWFLNTEVSAQEICEHFFSALGRKQFTINDIENDYDKVEQIIDNSF